MENKCDPPIGPRPLQSGHRVLTCLSNSGLYWTVFLRNRDTAVPAEGNGDLQTLICVLAVRLGRCLTLSNPVLWQNWTAAYPVCTLQMKMLFPGWPIVVHDTHTRRRRWKINVEKREHPVLCVLWLALLFHVWCRRLILLRVFIWFYDSATRTKSWTT